MSVLNKREYRYNSFTKNVYSKSTTYFNIDKDGYLYSDLARNNLYLNYPIVFFYNNWNEFLTIDTDDNINIHNTSAHQINRDYKEPIYTFHPNSKPVYITGRSRDYNYSTSNGNPDVYWYENALVTCKNGSVYMFTRNSRMDDCFNIDPVMTTIGDILPEGEVAFKACSQQEKYAFMILTMKGNVYYVFNNNKKSVKKLSNMFNVTDIAWDSWLSYNFCITEDGSVYYNLINTKENNFYAKSTIRIEGIDDAKEFTFHSNSFLWNLISSHTPNKFYVTNMGDLIHTFEFEENVIHCNIYNGYSVFVFEDGTIHTFHHILNGETNEWGLNDLGLQQIDVTNLRNIVVEQPAPYVNIPIDYYTYTYNPTGTGLTFQYRFGLNQNISNDGSRNVVNYVTEYSTDNGATWTAYNHTDCQGSRTYTLADVDQAEEELTAIAETASNRLKTYLDTLIGTITLPGNNGNGELTKEITGLKSGKKFYVKTTFTKGATTNTDCVINYQTVYGTTLNYGTIYNQGTVTVTVTGKAFSALTWSSDGKTIANNGPINYKDHTSILTALANDSSKGFFKKVQDLPQVQMFNVSIPGSVSGAETAATKYTTDAGAGGGDGANVYYYKVTYTQDDTTDTTNKIKIQVTYGNASNTVTTNTFYSDTYTILSTNYTTAVADIQNVAKGQVTDLKNFLNIPDVAGSLPATVERTYTKNNFAFKITIERAAKSATAKNIIITTPKVDGLIYGSAIEQTFHGTVASAITIINTKANELISAIETMCGAAPANTSSVYDKGNCHFTIGTNYSKTANSLGITINTMCDGVVHKTSTVTIASNSNKIGTYLTGSGGASPTATTDLNALKTILNNCPVNADVAYAKGNMNFTITKQFSKTAGSTTATYKVLVDGVEYQAATNVTLRPAQANLATDLATLGTNAGNYVTAAQNVLNGCPVDASEDKTKNGFNYTLGVGYTKTAGTAKATSFATLDGTAYSSNTYDFKITTFDANKTTLTNNATTAKSTLLSILNESPANTSEVKTYNGFKYNVKSQYTKTKGQNVVTIKTLFDDQTYKSETKTVDPASFANDLNAITLQASNRKTELLNILDDSPANTDTTIFTVDGFKYYVGATFSKAADNKQVTVKIKLDGADKETYTANINGSTTAADIAAIASNAATKVTNLKNSLRGLPLQSVPWTVNGFNFNLKVKYDKNLDDGKITISSYIDDTKHLADEVYDFVVDNIDTYSSKGDAKITALKNVVNNSPANTEKNVSKNNLSFKVGINYEKAKDSSTVYVYSMLDGNKLAGPHTVNFDPTNIAAISTKGATDLTLLENTLNACPANYTTNYNVGNMGFTIGSAFSKTAGNSTVTIQTTLDGNNYGSAATQTFNINDIGALATKAQEKELALKAILDGCPKDSLEKYVYKKFAFNIEKLYSKTAGYHVVTSMVKLDGVQYDQYHQENFNVSNIASLENSNNQIVEALKSRLVSVIPEDVHTTYSRNNFNFTIDAYYSKKEGSDVVDIEYNIDSADLSNDSDPISFSASSDMSHVNNG